MENQNPFEERWQISHQTIIRKRAHSKALARLQSGRNTFADRRIGESDPSLDDENRYLYRLQRERARKAATLFSLDDDHQPLNSAADAPSHVTEDGDESEEEGVDFDDDDGEFLKLKDANAQPNDGDNEEVPRTKQEVMSELIQKSKMYKAQRQQEKHVSDAQTEQLDEKLPEIMALLSKSANNSTIPKPTSTEFILSGEKPKADERATNNLSYESLYRQLETEKRARPSQRTLTEEEKAEREHENLIEMEKKRQARMQSMDSDDENEEGQTAKSIKQSTPRRVSKAQDAKLLDTLDEDVPYVFEECPDTVEALDRLFQGYAQPQRSLVLERLRKCFAISLDSQNAKKLEILAQCILQRIETLAQTSRKYKKTVPEIDLLATHIWETQNVSTKREEPSASAKGFARTVSSWATNIIVKLCDSLITSGQDGLASEWNVSDIILLRVIGRLFPCSDLRHPVATPLLLLLSQALSIHYMRTMSDIALGIFVANVLLDATTARSGYSGDLGKFCRDILASYIPDNEASRRELSPLRHLELDRFVVTDSDDNSPISLTDVRKLTLSRSSSVSKREKAENRAGNKLLVSVTHMVELMQKRGVSVDILLTDIPIEKLKVSGVRKRLLLVVAESQRNRVPLALYNATDSTVLLNGHRARVKLLNPKFSAEAGVYRKRPRTSYHARDTDVSASAKRIKRALRKEERGNVRDVRREAEVLAGRQAESERVRDEKREKRHREVMGFLENQRATWRAAEKRQKKLSGKKW